MERLKDIANTPEVGSVRVFRPREGTKQMPGGMPLKGTLPLLGASHHYHLFSRHLISHYR